MGIAGNEGTGGVGGTTNGWGRDGGWKEGGRGEVSEAYLDRIGGSQLREWEMQCSECVYVCMCVFTRVYSCGCTCI